MTTEYIRNHAKKVNDTLQNDPQLLSPERIEQREKKLRQDMIILLNDSMIPVNCQLGILGELVGKCSIAHISSIGGDEESLRVHMDGLKSIVLDAFISGNHGVTPVVLHGRGE